MKENPGLKKSFFGFQKILGSFFPHVELVSAEGPFNPLASASAFYDMAILIPAAPILTIGHQLSFGLGKPA